MLGDAHAANAEPSSEHSNDEPGSPEEKRKVASVAWVGEGGPESIVESGAVVSTTQVRRAGVGSTFPAASRARTSNACCPSARPLYAAGEAQLANAAPSREHSNPATASLAANSNVAAVAATVPCGPATIVVSGGVVCDPPRVHVSWAEVGVSSCPSTAIR